VLFSGDAMHFGRNIPTLQSKTVASHTCVYQTHSQIVPAYQITWHHIATGHNPYIFHCNNHKYNTYNGDLI